MRRISEYLTAAGASDIREVRPFLWQFRLPGDSMAAGRITTTRDGHVRIWHRGARAGLELAGHWQPSTPVELEPERSVPSYVTSLSNLTLGEKMAKVALAPPRYISSDAEVTAAAVHILEGYGWERDGCRGGIHYFNDGGGSTPACRLLVKNGVATVWSFRGDLSLPSPWRDGRALSTGEQTMYATARDLGVSIGMSHSIPSSLPPTSHSRPPVDKALSEQVAAWWRLGGSAPADHRHLTKSGVTLCGADMRLMPSGVAQYCGDLIVPLFRPIDGGNLEISGGQRLCASSHLGADKMLISGSRLADSFVPIPLAPLFDSGGFSIGKWIESLNGDGVKDRPLVICEGVATALAIYESGAGYPIAAISSGNIRNVAKWFFENGHAANFPGLVIAADYDVGFRNGKATSQAIKKAIDAAAETRAKVSLPPPGSLIGTDARDLYAKGSCAVRDYIDAACDPEVLGKRSDVLSFFGRIAEQTIER